MLDGTMTADPIEQDTTAIDAAAQDDSSLPTDPDLLGGADENGDQAEADAFEEIEHDGARHRIPKALKGAFLMQADYTRKTQELAEQRRGFDSERETVARSIDAQRAHLAEIGRIQVLDETLAQYHQVDWATLRAQDPDRANAAFQDFVQLRDQREMLVGKVHHALEQQSQYAQRSFAKRYGETNAILARDIKGWNQETANNVRDFALGNGVTGEQLAVIATTPTLAKLLHMAWLGDQLAKKQQAAAKAALARQAGESEVQPLQTVARRPSGAARPGLHDGLSADEWLKRRNEQLRKR